MPLRFLSFLSPEIGSEEIQPRNFRSLEIYSPEICSHEFRSAKPDSRNHHVSAERVDVCAARLFTICLLIAVVLSANLIVVHAQPQTVAVERALFDAANRERAAQGLAQLRWDDALANAAREHAVVMAQRGTLSHQFAGEPALQDRARVAGARFTDIAENVAEGPAADAIHAGWMHSPPHRANLLDPGLTAIGIAVVDSAGAGLTGNGAGDRSADLGGRAPGMLFAVEDFSQAVANLNLAEQERLVGAALAARGLRVANFNTGAANGSGLSGNGLNGSGANPSGTIAGGSHVNAVYANASGPVASGSVASTSIGSGTMGTAEDARKTCEMERGWAGGRPRLVVRYETGDLSRLPGDLEQKIQTGRYRAAAVGACEAGSSRGFTRFRVAVLLF
jgi:uncharacterized protein YkwD